MDGGMDRGMDRWVFVGMVPLMMSHLAENTSVWWESLVPFRDGMKRDLQNHMTSFLLLSVVISYLCHPNLEHFSPYKAVVKRLQEGELGLTCHNPRAGTGEGCGSSGAM